MNIMKMLPFIFIAMAVAILIHQYVFYDIWWEMEDMHHETWIIMFAFAGLVLLWRKR